MIDLWNAWQHDFEIREMAEAWITAPRPGWTADDDRLYLLIHADPEKALSVIFAMIQLTDDQAVEAGIAAEPLEDFLGVHGEVYLDTFHGLALRERRLREVLDGVWQGSMSKRVWHRIEILKQSAFS